MNTARLCQDILSGKEPVFAEIVHLLNAEGEDFETLRSFARRAREQYVGNVVHLRGLIEFSNICIRDCRYCGIRKSNCNVNRYLMGKDDILAAAEYSWKTGYGSVVLQSGERQDDEFVDFVTDITRSIKELSNGELGITLSCGVQSIDVFKMWKDAGADRYLLRIETTNQQLFETLHPGEEYSKRKAALFDLKKCGFITGTGVMTGLPAQSVEMLAQDVLFFKELDADMIGLGPYIPHEHAVLEEFGADTPERQRERLMLAYKMIAVCRLVLKNVNIAAATALSALDPERGRVDGLNSGANVVMPNAGNKSCRKDYYLYQNKPDTGEELPVISAGIAEAGCTVELFTQGNPPR
ncbi:MAG: [Lentisphaeria bacterium]|nr:[FeFe] hydrogenase H-cluster radical SAM maturase HydE [Lentisphaeria bacterium]MBQ7397136.1 [FeFe] hydrogenase H-cluster radical SAM maturase HydE [Lentisphaeria bacterium]